MLSGWRRSATLSWMRWRRCRGACDAPDFGLFNAWEGQYPARAPVYGPPLPYSRDCWFLPARRFALCSPLWVGGALSFFDGVVMAKIFAWRCLSTPLNHLARCCLNQVQMPVTVPLSEVARKLSLGAAIDLCAELGGYSLDKSLQADLGVDKGQFSRWKTGEEGVSWVKFQKLMDVCGNDAPLLWMLHQRGWDLHSLRRVETETERKLREANERIAAQERELAQERREKALLMTAIAGKVAA